MFFIAEIGIQGGFRHPGYAGDFGRCHLQALFQKQLTGGLKYRLRFQRIFWPTFLTRGFAHRR